MSRKHLPRLFHFVVYTERLSIFPLNIVFLWYWYSWRSSETYVYWTEHDRPNVWLLKWWIWINTSCEFIMNDCITTTKQSTAKPCAYFLGYTVNASRHIPQHTDYGRWWWPTLTWLCAKATAFSFPGFGFEYHTSYRKMNCEDNQVLSYRFFTKFRNSHIITFVTH